MKTKKDNQVCRNTKSLRNQEIFIRHKPNSKAPLARTQLKSGFNSRPSINEYLNELRSYKEKKHTLKRSEQQLSSNQVYSDTNIERRPSSFDDRKNKTTKTLGYSINLKSGKLIADHLALTSKRQADTNCIQTTTKMLKKGFNLQIYEKYFNGKRNSALLVSMIINSRTDIFRKDKANSIKQVGMNNLWKTRRNKNQKLIKADTLLLNEKYQQAADKYIQFIKSHKNYGQYLGLGAQYNQINYEKNPANWYFALIQKYQAYDCPYNGLGLALSSLNKQLLPKYKSFLDTQDSSCQLQFLKGLLLFNEGSIQSAKTIFEKCQKINPQSCYPIIGLAYCQKAQQKYTASLKLFDKAYRKTNSDYLSAEALIGKLKLNLTNNEQQKIQLIQQIQKLSDFNVQPYFELGNIYKNNEKNQQAIKQYQKAIKINDKLLLPYTQIAGIYCLSQNRHQLENCCKKYLKVNKVPSDKFYLEFGKCYNQLNCFKEAVQYFEKGLNINEQNQELYYQLGKSYKQLDQIDKAIEIFQKCIQLFPAYIPTYLSLGKLYRDNDQLEEAIKTLKKCAQINPSCHSVFYTLGKIYKEFEKYYQSIQAYKKSIEIEPKHQYSYFNIGNVYRELKQLKEARKWYDKAIQVNPKYHNSYFAKGSVSFELFQFEQAIQEFKKCIEVMPKYQQAYYGLGKSYYELQKYQIAIYWFERCIQVNPEYQSPYNALGNSLIELGKFDEAVKCYNKALKYFSDNPLLYLNKAQALIEQQNFKQAFTCFTLCQQKLQNDTKLSKANKKYIHKSLKLFNKEKQEWEHRIKIGFVTRDQIQRIKQMKKQFQGKFTNLGNLGASKSIQLKKTASQKIIAYDSKILNICRLLWTDKWNLNNLQKIGESVFHIFEADHQAFEIIAQILLNFFWKKKFEENQLSITDIQLILQQKVRNLSSKFKPGDDFQHISTVFPVKSPIKINLFTQSEYFPSYFSIITQIQKITKKAKKISPKFFKLAYSTQKFADGTQCKTGFKLPDNPKDWFKALIRIFEKMFKQISDLKQSIIQQIEQKINLENASTSVKIIQIIMDVWIHKIDSILSERGQKKIPTQCYLSDLVRAKCMFDNPNAIKKACKYLMSQCTKREYEITEIQNRINKLTHDIVFKINIDNIVCEFQLALESDLSKYQFAHSFYEIERSPLGCIFGTYVILAKSVDYSFMERSKDLIQELKDKKNRAAIQNANAVKFVINTLEKSTQNFHNEKMVTTKGLTMINKF